MCSSSAATVSRWQLSAMAWNAKPLAAAFSKAPLRAQCCSSRSRRARLSATRKFGRIGRSGTMAPAGGRHGSSGRWRGTTCRCIGTRRRRVTIASRARQHLQEIGGEPSVTDNICRTEGRAQSGHGNRKPSCWSVIAGAALDEMRGATRCLTGQKGSGTLPFRIRQPEQVPG